MRKKPRDTDKIVIQKMIGYCDSVEDIVIKFGGTFENFNSDFS